MTREMKKDKILHTIAKLVVPLKRTMSPLEADSYSAPGGHFFNRSLLLLLLMLTLGNNVAWGQDDYSGFYYIANYTRDNSKAKGYVENDPAGNYYLCPAALYYNDDPEMPYLTTKRTNQGANSIWELRKVSDTNFYHIIHYEEGGNGKYLVHNTGPFSGKENRFRVHLEKSPTLEGNNNVLFTITKSNGTFKIRPNADSSDRSLNPASGNKDSYTPFGNENIGGTTYATGGIIGLWKYSTGADDAASRWYLEKAAPIIRYNSENTIKITYPDPDASIYYSFGEDSTPSEGVNSYSGPINLPTGTTTIKAIAIKGDKQSGIATYTLPFLLGSENKYIIQSKNSQFYRLIPNISIDDNTKYVSTLNVPSTTMAWHFEYAEDFYYYIVDENGWYMYYTTTDNTNKYIYLKNSKDNDDDGFKFNIEFHANGGYNIMPKGQALSIYKNNYGSNDAGLIPVMYDGTITEDVARWDLIPYSTTNLPMWEDAPFTVSTDAVTNYYTITPLSKNTDSDRRPLIINGSGDVNSEVVPNGLDERKTMWVIKKVGAYDATDNETGDDNELLDFYTLQNAYTGELLFYNGNGNGDGHYQSTTTFQMGIPSVTDANEKWAHFVIVQTANNGYNIIPRIFVDNLKAINRTVTPHYGFNCLNRSGGNDILGTFYDDGDGSRWMFSQVNTTVKCIEPVFTEEANGDITITSVTNAAIIRYSVDGADPTEGSAEYTTKEKTSAQKIIKAIAIMGNDASTASNVVTLLNKPDITLAAGPYTYKGTAWEPEITKVSIGETEAPTTPVATYSVTSSSYSNNINAGENTALVTLMDANATDTWYFMNASTTFTIKKASLTVTAKNHSITYGDEPTGNRVEYSGFVNGETESVIDDENLAYDYTYEQYGDVGEYAITPKGLISDNYEFDYVDGTLTVIQKEVGLTWDPSDSSTPIATYDGQSHAPTVTANAADLVNGDVISVTVTPSANEGSSLTGADAINAGSYTATASGLTGTKAGNYSLPAENSQSFTISPKPVTVRGITVSDKIYDGTTDATIDISGAAIDGIVSGDNLSVASVTGGTFDTKDVGTDKTVTVVITTEGTSADNYELSASGLTADITPKPLTIKANDNAIGYGTAAVDNGVTYDSFVLGEDESLLEGTLTYVFNTSADGTGDAYTTSSPKGTYYIIPGGLHLPDGNNNYAISFAYGTLTVGPRKIGNGSDFAEGFTVNIDTSTSPYALTVYDGSTALIQGTTGTDYDYSIDTSESTDKYYVATITGANNYSDAVADRAIVKYANVRFDSDGSPGAMWYGTFVAEANHATPAGMTPYIITSVADNTATAVELDYIPNGVPVVLMNAEDAKGFLVQSGTGEISTTGNLLAVQATDGEKATATVYLLYKGEFVLNKAGILKAGTVYLPVSAGGGSGARLKISRGGNTGIENIEYTIKPQSDAWYTLDGRRLSNKPTKKGLYLQGGKKIVVK